MRKIKVLNETVWEGRASARAIEEWLNNFLRLDSSVDGYSEQLNALYLLSRFMYFGGREIRELLRSIYRDLYKYPIIEVIRQDHMDTIDFNLINSLFQGVLDNTRFLGVGNPSESGTHLLYYFRQENRLPKKLFINSYEIFERSRNPESTKLRYEEVERYVFIDDFCGSGSQASGYLSEIINEIRAIGSNIHVSYFMLCATSKGLKKVQDSKLFDDVKCILKLDDSFKCFAEVCRYFLEEDYSGEINKVFARDMCLKYGNEMFPVHPLGFDDCQLLIGFHHNTPDNSIPIFWFDDTNVREWIPIFRRYPKYYDWGIV
jgi:hypothetical protein